MLVRKRNDGRLSANSFARSLSSFRAEVIQAANLHRLAADNALVWAAFHRSLNGGESASIMLTMVLRSSKSSNVSPPHHVDGLRRL